MRNPVLPRGARPSGDRPRGGVQRSQCFKAQKCETLYSPARPVRVVNGRGGVQRSRCFKAQKCETLYSPAGPVRAVTGPAGEYSVLIVLRPNVRNPVLPREARPSGDRPRGGVQRSRCFKAHGETLYSPAGPVRAVTGPVGEYSVLNVLRHKKVRNPVLPRGARPSGDRPRGGVQRSQRLKPKSAKPCTPPRGPSER